MHSKDTIAERDSISTDRLQEGMLCYVGGNIKQYYRWVNGIWEEFTVNGSGAGDNNQTSMFRVDTYNDMIEMSTKNLEYGSLCHVTNDEHKKYLYYYGFNIITNTIGWVSIKAEYPVWISSTQPPASNYLWIDTSNSYIEDATIDNIPTFIDTDLIQYLVELIATANNEINLLKKKVSFLEVQVEDLNQRIEGGGGIVDNNIYITTEDGITLTTEDGLYFITEESDGIISGGNGVVNDKVEGFITEDGLNIITEDGNYIIPEN